MITDSVRIASIDERTNEILAKLNEDKPSDILNDFKEYFLHGRP